MNIRQAKEQIQNAMKAYFTKDTFGNYLIPIERQRPIFLMGPPGIGKTAIMEQVAAELGVNQNIYDRKTVYELAHGYLDGQVLQRRMEPIIDKKQSNASEDYYENIHAVLS